MARRRWRMGGDGGDIYKNFRQLDKIMVPGLLRFEYIPYAMKGCMSERILIHLKDKVLWDFPMGYIHSEAAQGNYIQFYGSWQQSQRTIRRYLDQPRAELLDPEFQDKYDLIDILRAGDRRLGFSKLAMWALVELKGNSPARQVLTTRYPW